jgi:hypothetical protein
LLAEGGDLNHRFFGLSPPPHLHCGKEQAACKSMFEHDENMYGRVVLVKPRAFHRAEEAIYFIKESD